ncbi:Chromatin structure remodeling complex protein sfh1 [Malassezia nana]|uniref:Chromatin structure remodeling complex protein sfh1 n=1 Tax=Malassezia nana TaxID=180528 RepID=A0AAF0J4N0_9BASI|nr:Chromatin structure remodeling complex protein sfh1 [Malassezia nana]
MSRMSTSYVGVADPSRTTSAGPASSATGSGSWVLGSSTAPVRPQTRIAPGQAKYSTYASRMRAGTTTLMQPIWRGSYDMEDSLGHSGRGRHTVYYGEDVSDDDEIEEADDDDDDDFESPDEEYGSQPRSKRRRSHLDDRASNSPAARPEPSDVEAEAEWASPGSQLGLPVPSRRLVVRPAKPVRPPYFSDEQLAQQGECPEVLVPIRVEFHTDTHRIKDVFLWNINERLITPYQFAHMFLQDLDLPITPYAAQIENLIIQQLADASAVLDSEDSLSRIIDLKTAARERKRLEAETEAQRRRLASTQAVTDGASPLSGPRKRGRPRKYPMPDAKEETPTAEVSVPSFSNVPSVIPASTAAVATHEEDPKAVEKARIHSMLASVDAEDDLRVIVEYKVQIARHILRDRLEWDLGSTWTPEAFARTLMRDLGLPPESRCIIAHAVHEQLLHHRRAASELGLFGSGKIYQCTMDELVQIERAEQAQQSQADATENNAMDEAEGAAALHRRAAASAATELDALDEYAVGVRDEVGPPNTRSRRMAAGSQASDSSLSVPFLIPDETLPLPVRRQQALVTLRDLLALGPRPLEGAWRDFGDVADFGPLLEYLSDAELEKMEEADLRASRRNRREAQRTGRTRRG